MKQTKHQLSLRVLIGLMALSCPLAWAGDVYKCVSGGKTSFSSRPIGEGQDCQPVELHVIEPNPKEVARQLELRRAQDEEDKKAANAAKKARDAEAARRAQAAKTAEALARQPEPWGRRGYRRKPGTGSNLRY